jgi:DNA-binding GntR family transcriptional regulator
MTLNAAIEGIGRLERVTLGDRVYEELRELLMAGKLNPGDKISLRSVAASLSVSIMPVREAVSRLVAEDALVSLPNRTVCVPLMTRRRFAELTAIRYMLEGYAAELAAKHRTEQALAEISRFEGLYRQAAKASKTDATKVLHWNKCLHFAIYRAARAPALLSIIEGLWLQVGPVISLDLRSSKDRPRKGPSVQIHPRIVAALEAGDGAAAREGIIQDIRSSAEMVEATASLPD